MTSRAILRMRQSGMRQKTFRSYDQDTLLLRPPSLRVKGQRDFLLGGQLGSISADT